ncbi:hypothetical protein VTN77DRAFT_479 [Rasamsonia byssochlamydoides]|uniref:uncharacterized protein n=1 Tax=Rasamsonia byssochlamydoides TaxID=89139 RepID=UPI0037431941
MSYGRDNYSGNPAEYGGGGSYGDNYYDRRADFSGESSRPSYGGRQEGGEYSGEGGHMHHHGHHGGEGYGQERPSGGYSGEGGYGDRPSYGGGRPEGHHSSSGNDYGDFSSAIHHAQKHDGGSSAGASSLFGEALNFLQQNMGRFSNEEIDESHMVSAHQSLYGGAGQPGRTHDSNTLGAGAAMQALKLFTSGGSSGVDVNELIGLAMAQASKLWEQQSSSGTVVGDKQSAVNKAAELAFKMFMKGQGSGLGGTGGPAGLLGLASKFL